MLQITIPATEMFSEKDGFVSVKGATLSLEHSLISISKWEMETTRPFLTGNQDFTWPDWCTYVRCMTLDRGVDPTVYKGLTRENVEEIAKYMALPMTATVINDRRPKRKGGRKKVVTSEEIYAQMFELGIPMECAKWHLNRLMTLIRVCSIRMNGSPKMSRKEILAMNMAENARRKSASGTRG